MLPALATPAQLAPLVGLTSAVMLADAELSARAQAALNAASSNVRDAAGQRTFLASDNSAPLLPDAVLTVVLDAARRGFLLYGSDGSYTTSQDVTVDDARLSTTRNLDATVLAGAALTDAEKATCANYGSREARAGAYSVPLGTPWSSL